MRRCMARGTLSTCPRRASASAAPPPHAPGLLSTASSAVRPAPSTASGSAWRSSSKEATGAVEQTCNAVTHDGPCCLTSAPRSTIRATTAAATAASSRASASTST
eukprot:5790279-Prymnesium_polylepis.1